MLTYLVTDTVSRRAVVVVAATSASAEKIAKTSHGLTGTFKTIQI